MPDPRFFLSAEPIPLAEAALIGGARVDGGGGRVARAASVDEPDLAGAVVFIDSPEARSRLGAKAAALALVTEALSPGVAAPGLCPSPRLAFARVAARLHRERPISLAPGVDPAATIGAGARIHETSVVSAGARIGARTVIGPYAVIGPGVEIGEEGEIGAGVCIVHSIVGARAAILSGARLGQAGFGFVEGAEGPVRVPQLGRVIIGRDVEIGANTAIDRGALGDTAIADGVKIDNLVQIGHNVTIGRYSILAAQIGIAGSSVVGERVVMGGQVGVSDHVTIGDGAQIAAGSGVMRDVGPGERWGGYPAKPVRQWLREAAVLTKLASGKKGPENGD